MRILIVDDNPLFAQGLRLLIEQALVGVDVACEHDGAGALRQVERCQPSLILLDWHLEAEPRGSALIVALREVAPRARLVVVSGAADVALVDEALGAGAAGFIPKASTPKDMVRAVVHLTAGGVVLPALGHPGHALPESAGRAMGPPTLRALGDAFPALTPRQQQVLGALARGLSNKAIARELDLAEGTVKQHVHAIYRTMGVDSRTEALYLLARQGVGLP